MKKEELDRLFRLLKEGRTQKECAVILRKSEGTISKHVKKAKAVVNREIALFSAGDVLDMQINYLRDLASLQKQTKDILDMVYYAINAEEDSEYWKIKTKLQKLIGQKGSLQSLMVALNAELRKQLQFSFDIDRVANDLEQIKKVQQVILETIQRTDLETARKIVAELARLKIIKSTLDFDLEYEIPSLEK